MKHRVEMFIAGARPPADRVEDVMTDEDLNLFATNIQDPDEEFWIISHADGSADFVRFASIVGFRVTPIEEESS